ncbi:LacI family DNA-binding transcriptional regulator [Consotaella salsifontis]|uniref:Transcriptional regulator, LacI family n=1 Tax=Consotaella salsifontis TaxID=1365950 RepID=A0A1T4N498_9HYPH|nr:LacI family DNA-binding transcriptional regulator [Consotaella salsifontis]SJZ73931.1 transcriptional regulator, LacI family [Consotaella salsifontis]
MARKPTKRRSTIYDIAQETGTSASTVSLVLNGSWERYRINADTAERILATAERIGYRANLRARGLRLNRSSLAGMIIPHYRNRFFAGLAEAFELKARERGLCPIVVSTQRDAPTERKVTQTLIAQQVEFLIIAGVQDCDELDELCAAAGIACVNLDLPGTLAPSVVTDNRGGARELTRHLVAAARERGGDPAKIHFVGGRSGEFATEERVIGFTEALAEAGISPDPSKILCCGYLPKAAHEAFSGLAAAGKLPDGLFVNSITAFEGFAAFFQESPEAGQPVVACFDWDPFAATLPLPVIMMRQNVEEMIRHCFDILDGKPAGPNGRIVVEPTLAVLPGRLKR